MSHVYRIDESETSRRLIRANFVRTFPPCFFEFRSSGIFVRRFFLFVERSECFRIMSRCVVQQHERIEVQEIDFSSLPFIIVVRNFHADEAFYFFRAREREGEKKMKISGWISLQREERVLHSDFLEMALVEREIWMIFFESRKVNIASNEFKVHRFRFSSTREKHGLRSYEIEKISQLAQRENHTPKGLRKQQDPFLPFQGHFPCFQLVDFAPLFRIKISFLLLRNSASRKAALSSFFPTRTGSLQPQSLPRKCRYNNF